MDMIRVFKYVAIAEAVSFLALLAAMVVKYGFDNEIGVKVLGPVHGVLFLAYAALALFAREELRWGVKRLAWVLALSAIPFGGFYVERRYLSDEAIATAP